MSRSKNNDPCHHNPVFIIFNATQSNISPRISSTKLNWKGKIKLEKKPGALDQQPPGGEIIGDLFNVNTFSYLFIKPEW